MSKENKVLANKELYENLKRIRTLADECLSFVDFGSLIKHKSNNRKNAGKRYAPDLDFTMPTRAFIKKYAKKMSGPKKFTLLVACLSKGDAKKGIKLEEIKRHWSKGLFDGKFNSFYSTQAKNNDWIDSKKQSEYNLRPAWKEVFKDEH